MSAGPDMVNHPPHYNKGKFETIDVLEDIAQHYRNPVHAMLVCQAIKYLARAPLKGNIGEDVQKAKWYLDRLVNKLVVPGQPLPVGWTYVDRP